MGQTRIRITSKNSTATLSRYLNSYATLRYDQ